MEDTGTVNSAPASSGPSTFAEAFAADASSASDTSQQSNTPSAAEQPTTPSEQATPADDRSPFIPRNRFDEVNTERNALKAWKEQYGWAESYNQQQLQQMQEFYQRFTDPQGDPVAFLQQLVDQVSAHPEHGAKLRSLAARQLAAGRGQQQPQEDAMPQPDVAITDGQGNVVGQTYSADQLAKRDAFLRQQLLSEIRKEFEPVTKTVQQVNAERAKLAADHFASTAMESFNKLPDFGALAPEIGQRLRAMNLQTDNEQVLTLAVKAIYADLSQEKRGQREQQVAAQAQSKLLDNLQHKAAASTGVNPGSAAPSTAKHYNSFAELPASAWD